MSTRYPGEGGIYLTESVFTPSTPASATFVERISVNRRFVDALFIRGTQILVYGEGGSGKTTLVLNKLRQTYPNHIVTHCAELPTYEGMLSDAFEQIGAYYASEVSRGKKTQSSSSVAINPAGIKAQVSLLSSTEDGVKLQPSVEPQIAARALAVKLGEAECCWVLDDIEGVDEAEKEKLCKAMRIFANMAESYPKLRIVAIGTRRYAHQVLAVSGDMRDRVAEVFVPRMNSDELAQLVAKGEDLLNISISSGVKADIVNYASGSASVCHRLCNSICAMSGIVETCESLLTIDISEIESAIMSYLEAAPRSLQEAFELAVYGRTPERNKHGRLILEALRSFDHFGASADQLLERIRRSHPRYAHRTLISNLEVLQSRERGAFVRYTTDTESFVFSEPAFRAYALIRFATETRDYVTSNNQALPVLYLEALAQQATTSATVPALRTNS